MKESIKITMYMFLKSLNNKIGIIDFRFILKKSNAMKLLGNKFLSLEKEINDRIYCIRETTKNA